MKEKLRLIKNDGAFTSFQRVLVSAARISSYTLIFLLSSVSPRNLAIQAKSFLGVFINRACFHHGVLCFLIFHGFGRAKN